MDEIAIKISVLLRETRKSQRLDTRELSKRSGLSLGVISRIERGLESPVIQTVIKLCNGFGISPEMLMKELGLLGEMNFDLPKMTLSEAGSHLRNVRKSRRLTQMDVYRETRIFRNIQTRIEKGRMNKLSFAYLVELDQFFPGSNILPVFWAVYGGTERIVDSQQSPLESLTANNSSGGNKATMTRNHHFTIRFGENEIYLGCYSASSHDAAFLAAMESLADRLRMTEVENRPNVSRPSFRDFVDYKVRDANTTMRKLSLSMGISPGYFSEMVNGEKKLTPAFLNQLADMLGVPSVDVYQAAGLIQLEELFND